MRTGPRAWVVLLLLPLVFVLSGCVRVLIDAEVSSDDTVSGTIVFGLKDEVLDVVPEEQGSLQDEMVGEGCDLPGSTPERYAQDGYTGISCTFENVSLDEFSGGTDGDLSITRDGDTYSMTGTLDLRDAGTGGEDAFGGSEMLDEADIRLTFTFPGQVTDTNGELSNGDRTVTFTPNEQGVVEVTATAGAASDESATDSLLLWVLIAVAVVVIVALIILVVVRRGRGKATPPPFESDAGPPGHAPPGQPGYGPPGPHGYGPPPGSERYGPPPQAQGYGPPPDAQRYGPPGSQGGSPPGP